MTICNPEKIKEILHRALEQAGTFEQCALLDYPEHRNVGDHLIWLGSIFYLSDVAKTKINYTAAIKNFSGSAMEKQIGKAPIFLNGGGNLGDIWPEYQAFREHIISKYRDRPIIILPQSIYFANPFNLTKAALIFNSHPNLTLFARDQYSYEIALKHFYNCHIILSPDMVFQMVEMPGLSFQSNSELPILYHCRQDKELEPSFVSASINLPNLIVEDWLSFKLLEKFDDLPVAVELQQLSQKVGQRNSETNQESVSWHKWYYHHPYVAKFNQLYNPSVHQKAWAFMYSGIQQFQQYRLVITNRLHGHILCTLLGIPHIFLPNSYHKNKMFYETWTSQIPFCRFVKDASELEANVRELLDEAL
ncbi:polysaccharide pyruvyl transferase family protein [uncultured Nostoc sp.]|uniref:polysaccharide pyruvyl transferase family protein n=1 Tax=uncultured Nostoc sp. TaxID=340711 RepID=UPI0035C95A47